MKRLELWIPALATVVLVLAGAMDAATRYLWVDELLTATLVSDPSISHMLRALADQVDTSPPLYYLLAWLWCRVAGVSAMSLRVLSALFASGSFWILWVTLRRYVSVPVRAAMLGACSLLPTVMAAQIAEARSYGLFLLLAAATLAAVDRATRSGARPGHGVALLATATTGLVLTHNYGVLYAAAALAAIVLAGFRDWRRPWGVYAAGAAWIPPFLLWLPSMRRQMDVGNPRFPIAVPDAHDLAHGLMLGTSGRALAFVAFFCVVAIIVARRSSPDDVASTQAPAPFPRAMLLTATLWVGVALAAWIASRVWRPMFLPRYLVPLGCAYAVLASVGLERALHNARARARLRGTGLDSSPPPWSFVVALGLVVAVTFSAPIRRAQLMPRGIHPAADSLELRYDLPVATISTHSYLPRVFYGARPDRYVFILDWESAIREDAPVGPTEYKLMAAMGRNYPSHRVQRGEEFLAQHDRFVVIDEAGLWWFKSRILNSPNYATQSIADRQVCGSGQPEDRCAVYLVERRPVADSTRPR